MSYFTDFCAECDRLVRRTPLGWYRCDCCGFESLREAALEPAQGVVIPDNVLSRPTTSTEFGASLECPCDLCSSGDEAWSPEKLLAFHMFYGDADCVPACACGLVDGVSCAVHDGVTALPPAQPAAGLVSLSIKGEQR